MKMYFGKKFLRKTMFCSGLPNTPSLPKTIKERKHYLYYLSDSQQCESVSKTPKWEGLCVGPVALRWTPSGYYPILLIKSKIFQK